MGILAYSPILVGGVAVYSAFGTARSSEGGYLVPYLLSGLAMLLGLFFGATSILGGEFVSGLIGLISGFFAIATVVSIAVFGLVKENPEGAAAAATAAAGAASAIDEMSNDSGNSRQSTQTSGGGGGTSATKQKQQRKNAIPLEERAKKAEWSMKCPSCGQQWVYNSGGMISGKDRMGYSYVGYDDTLETTEVQCENCAKTKRVHRKV